MTSLYFLPAHLPGTSLFLPTPNLSSPATLPPKEEESPDNGELRRTESSPIPLKRDRSFSEHDLAVLRGEMLPSLSESAQLSGVVKLRVDRPRSRTLTSAGAPPHHRGQNIPYASTHMRNSLSLGALWVFFQAMLVTHQKNTN